MQQVTAVTVFDPVAPEPWWLPAYVPELFEVEARRMPPLDRVAAALGDKTEIRVVPIPADCTDGFGQAFFARPERMLEPEVRRAMSAWSFLEPSIVERFVRKLSDDLASGAWDAEWGSFRTLREFDGGLRLVIGHP